MSPRRERQPPPVTAFLAQTLGGYDAAAQFPEDLLYRDKIASTLGPPIRGWIPELVFRYAIFQPLELNVDWAIMLYARPVGDSSKEARRRVERIDICDSEVHTHRFRMSDDPDDDQGQRKKLISLYAGDEATVSRQYDLQMSYLSREWEQRMRRWLDG
ncbi:hypothetical protein H7K45_27980 [Mycobacterium yunnanensis]|uniref:Uncharacterized protein n=1 Tax=Mycobacterium yunnanensis TaxID=368477 RepID=A0A9X2ZA61_9MYCO|nr:hypothetical protein [Mycobacterium yunnanensis]MCV7424391.1 hypothetical protein [Mycobacterium yunnanensis]